MYSILSLIYIFSFNFQDIKLLSNLGSISTIGQYYLLPLSFFLVIINFKSLKKIKLMKYYINFIFYFIVINIVVLIVSAIFFGKIEEYNQLFIEKFIQLFLHLIFQTLTLGALIIILKNITIKKIKNTIIFSYIFLISYFIYEKFILQESGRLKLTLFEPSVAGCHLTVIFLLALYFTKNRFFKLIENLIYFYILINIGSKGTILIFLIAVIFNLFLKKKFLLKRIGLILLLVLGSYFIFGEKIQKMFLNDILYYTSVITRSWSIITAIILLLVIPIGSGGSYLYFYKKFGEWTKIIIQKMLPKLNYWEINYMLDTGINLAPKAGIFFGIIIGGVGYIVFNCKIIKYFYSKLRSELKVLFIFIFLANLTYSSDFQLPIQLLVYAILQKIYQNKEE